MLLHQLLSKYRKINNKKYYREKDTFQENFDYGN